MTCDVEVKNGYKGTCSPSHNENGKKRIHVADPLIVTWFDLARFGLVRLVVDYEVEIPISLATDT